MNKSLNVFKCIAALCVVNMHCTYYVTGRLDSVIDALIRFAVPLFFMISGYYSCFKKEKINNEDKIKKRIVNVLKLLVLAWVVYIICRYIIYNRNMNVFTYIQKLYNSKNIVKLIILNISPIAGHLWFLYALLYCYIVMFIMNKFNIQIKSLYKYIPILLIFNIFFLGEMSIVINKPIASIYSRNFIFLGLPFFLIGHLINEKNIADKITNKEILITIILSILLIIIERLGTMKADIYIGTIFLTIAIFVWCIKHPNSLKLNALAWIGQNISSYIYILHLAVQWFVERIETNSGVDIKKVCYINTLLVFITTAIISILIYFIGKNIQYIKFKEIKETKPIRKEM